MKAQERGKSKRRTRKSKRVREEISFQASHTRSVRETRVSLCRALKLLWCACVLFSRLHICEDKMIFFSNFEMHEKEFEKRILRE